MLNKLVIKHYINFLVVVVVYGLFFWHSIIVQKLFGTTVFKSFSDTFNLSPRSHAPNRRDWRKSPSCWFRDVFVGWDCCCCDDDVPLLAELSAWWVVFKFDSVDWWLSVVDCLWRAMCSMRGEKFRGEVASTKVQVKPAWWRPVCSKCDVRLSAEVVQSLCIVSTLCSDMLQGVRELSVCWPVLLVNSLDVGVTSVLAWTSVTCG